MASETFCEMGPSAATIRHNALMSTAHSTNIYRKIFLVLDKSTDKMSLVIETP